MAENQSNINDLLDINNFSYDSIGDLSVVDSRVYKRVFAQKNEYTDGQTMNWEFNTGDAYLYGPTSYLTFKVQVSGTGVTSASFGKGYASAMNLFESSLLSNGEEIERNDQLALKEYHVANYKMSLDSDAKGMGSVQGFRSKTTTSDVNLVTEDRFVIPMSRLLGSFSNKREMIPSFMIGGSRLQVKLSSAEQALISDASPVDLKFTIKDPTIVVDSLHLVDSARLFLTKKASQANGLVFTYPSWNHQSTPLPGTKLVSSNVSIPVSHALMAWTVIRSDSKINSATVDSYIADALPASGAFNWRYRLGSQSYPEERVENQEETYIHAQRAFGKMAEEDPNSVTLFDYQNAGHGVLSQSFNRSHLSLSGLPLNTGSISLFIEYNEPANATNKTLDTFTQYVKTASSYADGRVVVMY